MTDATAGGLPAPRPVAKTRRVPIAVLLSLLVGLPVFVAVLLVLGIATFTGFTATLSLVAQRTELLLTAAEDKVRGHLDPAAAMVASLVARIEGEAGLRDDEDRLVDLFAGALAGIGTSADVIAFIRPNGSVLAVRLVDGQAAAALLDTGPDTIPFFRQAFEEGRLDTPYWDEIRVLPLSGVTINVHMAVRDAAGDFAGAVAATVPVRALSAFLSALEPELGGDRAYLLAADGTVVAHPLLALGTEEAAGEDEPAIVGVADLGDPVLARFDEREPYGVPFFSDITMYRMNLGAIEFIVLERALPAYGPTPLTLGVYFERTGPPQELQRILLSAALGAVVMVIAVVASLLLARAAARPIRLLAGNAEAIGALEFSRVRPLPPSRVAEFDDQARAFNAMTTSLHWFETYVPRRLVHRLAAGDDDTALKSQERELTILFTDIAGFTALSEETPAQEVAALLNRHFEGIAAAIEAEDGTIDKFLGDGLMAFWGAPVPDADHALKACRAVAAIAVAAAHADRARAGTDQPPMVLRAGLHTGRVVVGNIGAPGRMNYTVIGDPVNVASRLEQAGKALTDALIDQDQAVVVAGEPTEGDPVVVLLSEATVAAASAAAARHGLPTPPVERLGERVLEGRQAGMTVFRLSSSRAAAWLAAGRPDNAGPPPTTRESAETHA